MAARIAGAHGGVVERRRSSVGMLTHRRTFVRKLAGVALAMPLGAVTAQPATKVHRIGFLGNSTAALEANLVGPFREGLRDLGYVDGRNLVIEYRWAEGDYKRFPKCIAELVALGVEMIVTAGTPAAQAVQRIAPSMPLVMVAVGDPVGTGLVASLAHPGGKSTGLTSIAPDLEGKRLELLARLVPGLSHVAVIWNPDNAFHAGSEREVQAASHVLHFDVLSLSVRTAADFDKAFDALAAARPGALIVLADRVYLHNRARVVDFVARQRLPAVYPYREFVDAGGLMSFGPDYAEMHRRAATYVDKILQGANPGELPIEQPTKFRLLINLRTARAMGLAIPQSLLMRADEVIR